MIQKFISACWRAILWLTLLISGVLFPTLSLGSKIRFSYQELLKPLDIYSVPSGASHVLKRQELYQWVIKRSLNVKQARQDFAIAKSVYETTYYNLRFPRPSLGLGYSIAQSANGSLGQQSVALSFTGSNKYGLNYSLDLPRITRNPSTYPNASDPTQLTVFDTTSATIGLSLSFPFLRNSYFVLGNRLYEEADLAYETARHTERATLINQVAAAEQAFYDVMLKQIRVMVLESSLASSKALKSDVEEMIKVGESDRIAQVKVDLQIAQAELELLQGQNDLVNSKQMLSELINFKDGDVFPDPNEVKDAPAIPKFTVAQAIEKAKQNRSDWVAANRNKRKAEIDVQVANSNLLPKLDATASYGLGGQQATFNQALSLMQDFSRPYYSVGLTFVYDMFDETNQAAARQAKIRLSKAEISLEQLQNQITREIRNAMQSLDLGSRRLKTGEITRKLAEKKLAAEFEKFRLGESNIRNIVDFQKEVENARIAELTARIDMLRQITALRTAVGDLPEGFDA